MSDSNFDTAGQAGDLRISITTDNEVLYWTKALNCTEEQLRDAITTVGPMLLAVREHLAHPA